MEPEISRRCPACGASVRARAAFCPNCGRPTGDVVVDTMAVAETPEKQELERAETVAADSLPDTSSLQPAANTNESDSGARDESVATPVEVASEDQRRAVTFAAQDATQRAHTKRQRVRTAAREAVEENLLPRVERLRQASNVVLDEATYDPSLRFVLIALALFLIFLVILLASSILK